MRTALQLFYSDGVRAVGIDRLIAEADVAKASFYAHFKSKQDLVVAYLEAWSNGWMSWMTDRVRAAGGGSTEGVGGLFDGLEALFKDPEYRGCAFANALAEVGGEMPGVRTIGQAHKRRVADLIAGVLSGGNRAEGRTLAQQIVLVMDGAMATAARDRTAAAARQARAAAELLVERYRGSALLT